MRGYYIRRALASSCGLEQTVSQAGVRPGSKSKYAVASVRSVTILQQVASRWRPRAWRALAPVG